MWSIVTYTSAMAEGNARPKEHFVRKISKIRQSLERAKSVDREVETWSKRRVDDYLDGIADEAFTVKTKFVKNLSPKSYTYIDRIPCKLVATFEGGKFCLFLKRDMKIFRNRRYSFIEMKWPGGISTFTSQLAEAGFFYEGDGDTVKCFSCNGQIRYWEGRTAPIREHRMLNSMCEFVTGLSPSSSMDASYYSDSNLVNSFDDDVNTEVSLPWRESLHVNRSLKTRDHFKSEFNRLLSYRNWSYHEYVQPSDLAASGLYCISDSSGIVECFSCGGRIADWKQGDRPHRKHLQMYPRCAFIRNEKTDNRTMTSDEKEKLTAILSQENQTLENVPQQKFPDPSMVFTNKRRFNNRYQESARDPFLKYAKYQQYYTEYSRLGTFSRWPLYHCQEPEGLAKAGFYSTQNGDETKCFYCGGGLQNWLPEYEPWEEHARWFSRCDWMLHQKGSSFVNMVKRKFDSTDETGFAENTASLVPRRPQQKMTHHQQAEQATKNKEDSLRSNSRYIEQELEEALETDVAKFMLDMGYSVSIIRSVMRKRLEAGERPFTTSEDLLLAIERESNQGEASNDTSKIQKMSPDRNLSTRANEIHVDGDRCYICEYKPIEIVTVPCHHSVVCEDCSAKSDVCVICRAPIEFILFIAC